MLWIEQHKRKVFFSLFSSFIRDSWTENIVFYSFIHSLKFNLFSTRSAFKPSAYSFWFIPNWIFGGGELFSSPNQPEKLFSLNQCARWMETKTTNKTLRNCGFFLLYSQLNLYDVHNAFATQFFYSVVFFKSSALPNILLNMVKLYFMQTKT